MTENESATTFCGMVLARLAVFAHAYLNGAGIIETLQWFVYVSIAGNAVTLAVGLWLARSHDETPRDSLAL